MKIFFQRDQMDIANLNLQTGIKSDDLIRDWIDKKYVTPSDVCGYEPLKRDDFFGAHDKSFVEDVFNGLGAWASDIDPTLVSNSLQTAFGSIYAAAEYVVRNEGVACAPTPGFHLASYFHGNGRCPFNGQMVAALKLLNEGLVETVGILDCDSMYGNGTSEIISHLGLEKTVLHKTAGSMGITNFSDLIYWLHVSIKELRDCDVVLYQCSISPKLSNILGSELSLTSQYFRDLRVFERLPRVAWSFTDDVEEFRRLRLYYLTVLAATNVESSRLKNNN